MVSVASLRAERKRSVVALDKFMKLRQKNRGAIFCLFEGEDPKYYSSRICTIVNCGATIVYVDCGGKDAVIDVLDIWLEAEDDLQDEMVYAFRDRDFDETLPQRPNLYITPTYSIENLYVTETAFRKILNIEFKLSVANEDDDLDMTTCVQLFRDQLANFHGVIRPLNTWIKARRKTECANPYQRLHLDGVEAASLFDVDLRTVTRLYSPERLDELYKQDEPLPQEAIDEAKDWLAARNPGECFRGKYQLIFFRDFLIKLKSNASKDVRDIFRRKRRCTMGLSGNPLSDLSNYADTPKCLTNFLEEMRDQFLRRIATAA